MLTTGISGAAELRWVAEQIRKARIATLKRELAQGTRDAFKPLQAEIKAEALKRLPSGYGPIMARAVRVTVSRRGMDVTATVWAKGKAEERDVRAVNAGRLRHPTFGHRSGRSWVTQRVMPGFATDPADRLADRIVREGLGALDTVVHDIVYG